MKIRALVCLFAAACGAALAQEKSEKDPLATALSLRAEMTAAILEGGEKPEQAMARLRAHASPSGLKVERNADFALAAIDVGLRLIAADKTAEAEQFFQAAKQSLLAAIDKTKDEAAQEKALYLQQLAFIRANFLNEGEAADDDLDAAIALQPDDQNLKQRKEIHARGKAEQLKQKSKL